MWVYEKTGEIFTGVDCNTLGKRLDDRKHKSTVFFEGDIKLI